MFRLTRVGLCQDLRHFDALDTSSVTVELFQSAFLYAHPAFLRLPVTTPHSNSSQEAVLERAGRTPRRANGLEATRPSICGFLTAGGTRPLRQVPTKDGALSHQLRTRNQGLVGTCRRITPTFLHVGFFGVPSPARRRRTPVTTPLGRSPCMKRIG